MADTTQQPYPLTIGGKKVEGILTTYPDGTGKWAYKADALPRPSGGYGPLIGDYSTFTSKKGTDGKWQWTQTTDTSIANLAKRTGLTSKQVSETLYNNPTLQNGLNQQRVNQLGGTEEAAKLGVPGATNVATPGSAASTTEASTSKAIQDTIAQVGEGKARGTYATNLQYPVSMKSDQDCIRIEMFKYSPKKFNQNVASQSGDASGELFTAAKERTSLGSVILPIQSPINDSNTVTWGEDRMNAFEAIGAATALNLISGKEGDGIPAKNLADGVAPNAAAIGAYVGTALAQAAVTGSAGGNLFTRLTGAIINPNLELLFNGPTLRTFGFTFLMSARDEPEAKVIRSIIRFFKQGMSVKRAKSNLFLISPNVFDISYLYRKGSQDQKHPWMNRIKTCALVGCSVNYTPGGSYSTYTDGSMTAYEVSLQFHELTPIYDDDYSDTTSGGDDNKDTQIGY